MATQKYTTLGQGTLSSAYTAGATSLVLNTGQGATFPSSGDFVVALNDPPSFFLKCTARTGDTLTVATAAVDGTTTSNQAIGVTVTEVVTASVLDGMRSDMSSFGAAASLPTTTEAHKGDQYQCSDAPMRFVFDGTLWQPIGPTYPLVLPKLSDFTTSASSGATATDTGAGIAVVLPTNGSLTAYKTATLTAPFKVTCAFTGVIGPEDFGQIVMTGKDSASGNFINFGLQHNTTGSGVILHINKINSGGTFNSQYKNAGMYRVQFGAGLIFLRIQDDGTNRKYYIGAGPTDNDMLLFHSTTRTDFCTANTFGWNVGGSTNYGGAARLVHWSVA